MTSPASPPPIHLRRLATPAAGLLWLSAMPGRDGGWGAFVEDARRADIRLTLCLTPRHEIEALSPAYAEAIRSNTLPFDWQALAMRDFGIAESVEAFAQGMEAAALRLRQGDAVLLHCAAGIGRTGTAAACLLMRLGMAPQAAMVAVRGAGSNPQSATQQTLINRFARSEP